MTNRDTPVILLVEDDPDIGIILDRLMRDFTDGLEIVHTHDSDEALIQLALRPVCLVVTDYNMPGMNGLQLNAAIKKVAPMIKVILITAYATPELQKRAREYEVDYYFPKPFPLDKLEQVIRDFTRLGLGTSGRIVADHLEDDLDIYKVLGQIATSDSDTLLVIRLEGDRKAIEQLVQSHAIAFPGDIIHVPLTSIETIAIIPHKLVEQFMNQFIENFYAHPLLEYHSDVVLTYGWAHGPYKSLEELVVATARDLAERCLSQGINLSDLPSVLLLIPGLMGWHQSYNYLQKRHSYLKNQISLRTASDDLLIRKEIEHLITVIQHDLNSGFTSLKSANQRILESTSESTSELQSIANWLQGQICLCEAWQQTILDLSDTRLLQKHTIAIQSRLRDYLNRLSDHLDLSITVTIDIPETLYIEFDSQELLVSCLIQLIVLEAAQATQLHIVASVREDESIQLSFEDDGRSTERCQALQTFFSLAKWSELAWPYCNLALLPQILQPLDITLSCEAQSPGFKLIWIIPKQRAIAPIAIGLQRELQSACAELRPKVDQLEKAYKKLNKSLESPEINEQHPSYEDQARQILRLYMHELASALLVLANKATILPQIEGSIGQTTQRVRHLALYCFLLVRNLVLVLQGAELPIEQIDVNKEIHQVIDLLEHKLMHLEITYDLAPVPLYAGLSPVEMKQVLMNLIKNAAEATPKGGRLHINTIGTDDKIIIQIHDTGYGIDSEHRTKIFDLNFSTKGRGDHSGVGLYAVRSILQRVGGIISVASLSKRQPGGKRRYWTSAQKLPSSPIWNDTGTLFQIELPRSEEL